MELDNNPSKKRLFSTRGCYFFPRKEKRKDMAKFKCFLLRLWLWVTTWWLTQAACWLSDTTNEEVTRYIVQCKNKLLLQVAFHPLRSVLSAYLNASHRWKSVSLQSMSLFMMDIFDLFYDKLIFYHFTVGKPSLSCTTHNSCKHFDVIAQWQ